MMWYDRLHDFGCLSVVGFPGMRNGSSAATFCGVGKSHAMVIELVWVGATEIPSLVGTSLAWLVLGEAMLERGWNPVVLFCLHCLVYPLQPRKTLGDQS